jgi:thioredoxin 1
MSSLDTERYGCNINSHLYVHCRFMTINQTVKLPRTSPQLLVACLCADWCGACREYKPQFDALALTLPDVRFLWLDVEDQADLIDPIEVENFPTVLIAKLEKATIQPVFFGTVLPHIETLERLIQAKQSAESALSPPATPATTATPSLLELQALVNKLHAACLCD